MISTYAELKQAIERWGKRSDSISLLDDFIDLAESDIWQRLKMREMDTRTTATLSTSTRYLALPTGFLSMRKFKIDQTDVQDIVIEYRTPEQLYVRESVGVPSYYTITSQIELDRVADQAYTVEMQYYASLTALSASNTINAVLTRYPQVYLYGSLMHYFNWAQDDEMFNKYALMFDGAIKSANRQESRSRRGSMQMIVNGWTP